MRRPKKRSATPCKKHRWMSVCIVGTKALERGCWDCTYRESRPMTKAEQQQAKREQKLSWARSSALHKTYHKLLRVLYKDGKVEAPNFDSTYEASGMIERFAKRHKGIMQANVDDDAFMGSDLFFIPHMYNTKKLGSDYMGTTVIYAGQCEKDLRVFFMYPSHSITVSTALSEIRKMEARFGGKKEKAPYKWKF